MKRKRLNTLVSVAVVLLFVAVVLPGTASAQVADNATHPTIIPIAIEGQEAPGTGGQTFDGGYQFDEPMVNGMGDVAFIASYGGSGQAGVFLWRNGKLSAVAVNGQVTAVGIIAAIDYVNSYDGPAINNQGMVVFVANVDGNYDSTLYQKEFGQDLTAIAKVGDTAPGGGTFEQFDDFALNHNGDVAFIALYDDGGSKTGVFLKPRSGAMQAIVRNGDTLPGTGGGYQSDEGDSEDIDGPWMNDAGMVAFISDVISGGTGRFEGSVFIKKPAQPLEPLVLIGDPAPESIGGTIDSVNIGRPGLNNTHAVLKLSMTEEDVGGAVVTKELGGSGEFRVCAQADAGAPVSGTDYVIEGLNGHPVIAPDGTVGFAANVRPPGCEEADCELHAILAWRDGKVTAIAIQGDNKPVGTGNLFGQLEEMSIGGASWGSCVHWVWLDEYDPDGGPTGVFKAAICPQIQMPPPVPTVNQWGVVAMISLFAGLLVWTVRKRRPAL